MRELKKFNVGEDCPVFDGVFEFCQVFARRHPLSIVCHVLDATRA